MSVLVLRFCALKLIFKLISGKECIADCALSFELVRRRKIASWLFLRLAVKIASAYSLRLGFRIYRVSVSNIASIAPRKLHMPQIL